MGVVVAPIGDKQIEEVIGVHIVANPSAAGDLKIDLRHGIEVDLPLLVGNRDINPQLGLPHLLNGYRNFPVSLVGVVENLEPGPTFAIGIARFGKQLASALGIVVKKLGRVVPQGIRWCDGVGRYRGLLQHSAHQLLTIYRQRQRLAHAHVINRRALGIDQVVVSAEVGCLHVGGLGHVAVERDFVERYHLRVMQLLNAEHALLADHVLHGVENHRIQRHLVTIPVVLAFLDDDPAIQRPLGQREGAVTDDIADAGPGRVSVGHFTKLHERFGVHREGAVVVHELHKVGCRGVQGHFECGVIEGLHADFVEVGDLALEIRLGVDQREQHVGVLVTCHRVQRPVPAPHIVAGCHLFSVGPLGVRV